jgi:glycosyltransferase involved in cell wall biosynthesis
MPRPIAAENTLVSVVVPVFNRERFLDECLESVFAQKHRPIEVIVVDDGSTDASVARAEAWGDRVRLIRRSNGGPSAARNSGVDAARGDFIAFIDSDDLWLPELLSKLLRVFAEAPQTDICVAQAQNFWMPELADEEARYRDHPMSKPFGGYLAQGCMARREVFERFARWDENLPHGETMVWFEACVSAGAVFHQSPEVLVRRRFHGANLTRVEVDDARDGLFAFLRMRVERRKRTPG